MTKTQTNATAAHKFLTMARTAYTPEARTELLHLAIDAAEASGSTAVANEARWML